MLEGKVVIITGAKGGLGSHMTRAFLDAGATVAGLSRSIKDSDFDHPGFAAFPAGLSTSEAARSAANAVVDRFGRVDVLVHLVGGYTGGAPVTDVDEDSFDRMFDLNVRSAFYMLRAVLPHMRKQSGGRVIAIGSRAAVEPIAGAAAYSASKAALVALVQAAAKENTDACISANVILPGTLDEATGVHPSQVAALAVSLAGPLSQITGAVIPVYGHDLG